MIRRLKGKVDEVGQGSLVIDVHGVGYLVFCSESLIETVSMADEVTLEIEMCVREDFIHLYGFATSEERQWFQLLRLVQGVGAKVALALLSTVEDLTQAVTAQNVALLERAPGVGRKLAQRILNELQGKELPVSSEQGGEARSALINLGYLPNVATQAVAQALKETPHASLPDLIARALQEATRL